MSHYGKFRICTSIYASNYKKLQNRISEAFSSKTDIIEIRTDYLTRFNSKLLEKAIGPYMNRCIITCRPIYEGGHFIGEESIRLKWLSEVAEMNPAFIDLELESAKTISENIHELFPGDISLIISSHNYQNTPTITELKRMAKDSISIGSYVKIITKANSIEDNTTILSLYNHIKRGNLISFCMGNNGLISRILCPMVGSPFTYASLGNLVTADGQIPVSELKRIYEAVQT